MYVLHWSAYDGEIHITQPTRLPYDCLYIQGDLNATFTSPGDITINTVYTKHSSRRIRVNDIHIYTNEPYNCLSGLSPDDGRVAWFTMFLDDSARDFVAYVKQDPWKMAARLTDAVRDFLMY